MIERLRHLLGLSVLHSLWIVRQPLWIVNELFFLLSLSMILLSWGGRAGAAYMISGFTVALAFGLGVNGVGQTVGYYRVFRVLDVFLASPVTPRSYVFGALIGEFAYLPPAALALGALSLAVGMPHVFAYSLLVSLLLLPSSVLLGLSLAFYVKKPGNISAITNPISTALIMLPPVFYPASAVPEPLRTAVLCIPTASAAELARFLSGLGSPANPLFLALVLFGWLAATAAAANRVVRWGLD